MKGKCHLEVKKEITYPEDKGKGRFICILKLIWERTKRSPSIGKIVTQ